VPRVSGSRGGARIVKRRSKRLLTRLAIAAALLAAAVAGLWWYLDWRHRREIEDRLGRHGPIIWKYAQANALPSEFVREIIRAESGGDQRAVSPKGAKGLMQVTPIALKEVRRRTDIGDGDLFDPDYNIRVGTAYFRMMLDAFDGDAYLALAAYNMGPTRLRAARRENPDLTGRQIVEKSAPAETRAYCRKILGTKDLKLPTTTGG